MDPKCMHHVLDPFMIASDPVLASPLYEALGGKECWGGKAGSASGGPTRSHAGRFLRFNWTCTCGIILEGNGTRARGVVDQIEATREC